MRVTTKLIGLISLGVSLTGCYHPVGIDSFTSATTPVPPLGQSDQWKGDPGAAAGVAEASGGTMPATPYGNTARTYATGKIDPSFDQPAMGTGKEPGEYPVEARAGFGNSNAPGNQASPSEANNPTAQGGR